MEHFSSVGRPMKKTSINQTMSSVESLFVGLDVHKGAVAELVGIEGGVVSGVINLESSGVEASDWRPRHDEHYHEA